MRLAVWMAALLLPLLWTAHPLSRLTDTQRDAVVTRMAGSRSYVLRQLVGVLKLCAAFASFGPTSERFP